MTLKTTTPTAYDELRAALLGAGSRLLWQINAPTHAGHASTLGVWALPGGYLRIVQHWQNGGGWDAYKPIISSKTDEAIREVLQTPRAADPRALPTRTLATLQKARRVISTALTDHIYNAQDGETAPLDCEYTLALRELETLALEYERTMFDACEYLANPAEPEPV